MHSALTPLFVLVLMFVLDTGLNAKDKIVKETTEFEGKSRTYYLLVPESPAGVATAPLLLAFHGSGRNGMSIVEPWKKLAAKEGIIVVGPDASDSRGWAIPADGPDFIQHLVDVLRTQYRIDPRRVYLFGHSAGATFALMLSLMQSEYFAATAVHAGAVPGIQQFTPMLGERRRIPIAIWVGDRDAFFPVPFVSATVDFLKANGFEVQFEVIKGHDHFYYATAEKINQAAWTFLASRALEADPKWQAIKVQAY